MESSQLVSWQSENFSTAELSPPISPASPLFYDGSNPSSPSGFKGLLHNTNAMLQQSQKPLLSPVLDNRAQFAKNMLNELEQLHSFEDENPFSYGFKEESVNLNNLFEELADLEYTPPLFSSDDTIEVPKSPVAASPAPMVPSVVVPPPSTARNAGLSAEFKSIVESLNIKPANKAISPAPAFNNKPVASIGDLFQIAGIPTTTTGDNCLVPVEFIGRPTTNGFGAEEAESMDLDGIIISNDMEIINENELFNLGLEELAEELISDESSNGSADKTVVDGVMPYWAKDLTIPADELDCQMNKNVETLDALLKGDVSAAAKNVMPSSAKLHLTAAYSPISTVASDDECSILETAEVIEVAPLPKPVESAKKPERRGRKPAKAKNALNYVKDKALRKKEQNKTAATRYRQKKKQELVLTLAEEEELQQVHDELEKEKEKVGGELRMIRSLLRDMLQVRKKRTSATTATSVPLSASRLTASSLVQAQRIANRKK